MSIIDIFTNPLILTMFLSAILIGVLISLSASLLGVPLILKKYSMLGDGLAHIGFGSMAIGALTDKLLSDFFGKTLGSYSLLISVPIVIASAILILKISEKAEIEGDSAIALVSTSALAVGYIIYKYATGQSSDVCSSMFGSASLLTPSTSDTVITVVLSVAVIGVFIICYEKIFAITFDPVFSKSAGINVGRYDTVIAILVAVTVVIGMKMLGTVMISGLIVFPAVSAMKNFSTFKGVVISSCVISVFCSVVGILLAFLISNMPIGPCVVMVNLAVFIASSIIKKSEAKLKAFNRKNCFAIE